MLLEDERCKVDLENPRVKMFGSTVANLYSPSSDLDLFLCVESNFCVCIYFFLPCAHLSLLKSHILVLAYRLPTLIRIEQVGLRRTTLLARLLADSVETTSCACRSCLFPRASNSDLSLGASVVTASSFFFLFVCLFVSFFLPLSSLFRELACRF